MWNIAGVPANFTGAFSAQGIGVVGGAVGTAPPAYAAPPGSGGQLMMVSGGRALFTSFGGVAQAPAPLTGTLEIEKSVPDPAYYGPAGAQIRDRGSHSRRSSQTLTTNATGDAGPSVPLLATTSGTQYRVHQTVAPPATAWLRTRW